MDSTEISINNVDLTVSYEYHRACKGAMDSLGGIIGAGPPLEPDEPAYVEICSVKLGRNNDGILGDVDIYELLHHTMIAQIEDKVMNSLMYDYDPSDE